MEVKGKLIKKLQAEAGTSQSGKTWESQTILVDTEEKFNNIVAIKCFGDKVKKMNKLKEGDMVSVSCNVYSREYNGKYYNQIDGWFFVNQNENLTDNRSEFVTTDDDNLPF
mgnify:FL=1|tara:strand:+ start:466 stop:798 length:333 start_codon:yes stop_codon:yes gene_type:complete